MHPLPLILPLLAALLLSASQAQQSPSQPAPHNPNAQVSILCYHDFINSANTTPMRISATDFRAQMQALQEHNVPVISMAQFLAWRRGEARVPDPSVVITIDDGWRSVYEIAYPILREYDYPFTLYLYKDFVDIGGLSLTKSEILEMTQQHCTLGSHSITHPYPQRVTAILRADNPERLQNFLQEELTESREFLQQEFNQEINTYAYPGGFYSNAIRDYGLQQAEYAELFTVNPGRAHYQQPRGEVNRYVIHGDNPDTFTAATTFHGVPLGGAPEHDGIRLSPAPDSTTSRRLPLIQANLSAADPIDPGSIVMRVSGLGQVPASYNPQTQTISYAITTPLRTESCQIFLSWRPQGSSERAAPLNWSFQIRRSARYEPFQLPRTAPTPPTALKPPNTHQPVSQPRSMTLPPIGTIRTPWSTKFGVPRQANLIHIPSTIQLRGPWANPEAVRHIEAASHLWLISQFHQIPADQWSATVRPPRLGGNQRIGVFASRSPFRPNPLSLSCVKYHSWSQQPEGLDIHISGADSVDQTPLFDIKPYLPYADQPTDPQLHWAPSAPSPLSQPIHWHTQAQKQLSQHPQPDQLQQTIETSLRHDPRPAYHNDPQRHYHLPLIHHQKTLDIHFQISPQAIQIHQLTPT